MVFNVMYNSGGVRDGRPDNRKQVEPQLKVDGGH
jgi:hypothetical protein